MYAARISAPGGPEVLGWGEVPEPRLRPGEVLIDVAAAGVNRADLLQRLGRYDPPPGESDILGLECSGTIVAAHDDVRGVAVGQHVCALLAGGGYAEQVAVPATQVLPLPQGVSLADAAALPEAVCTVWSNLVLTAGLSPGHFVLVHGGSSGVGTAAVQIARAIGARVGVTASSTDKLDACRELGADVLIDYRTEDFVERTLQATSGRGADVILDVVGGPYLARNVRALADGGRLVIIGLLGGATGELNLSALMARRAGVIGTQLRTRPATGPGSKAEVVAAVGDHVWPLIASGAVRPVIGARFPMDRAGAAHRLLESGHVVGKVVLTRPA
ncbi:MAG: NAD(P)H-quinone oxidoreductase [Actinobacteria bacterium 69-20]|nr:NAD(P)H-quinone oxidoreductase [Actinomycetota bacterium]OJV29050.1 MAG: NAD(P)H-quinone oxidoreductase [Actinobacteria bacterium 69-20]